jgi:hypothetical protein
MAKCSWCLTPLLTIFQLVYIVVVLLVEETGVPGENCLENTGQMSHLNVSTFFLHINQLKKSSVKKKKWAYEDILPFPYFLIGLYVTSVKCRHMSP